MQVIVLYFCCICYLSVFQLPFAFIMKEIAGREGLFERILWQNMISISAFCFCNISWNLFQKGLQEALLNETTNVYLVRLGTFSEYQYAHFRIQKGVFYAAQSQGSLYAEDRRVECTFVYTDLRGCSISATGYNSHYLLKPESLKCKCITYSWVLMLAGLLRLFHLSL